MAGDGERGQEGNTVLLFDSTHAALAAEEAILDGGFWCDIVPRPPGAGDGLCGLAVAVNSGDEVVITALLGNAGVGFAIYHGDKSHEQ